MRKLFFQRTFSVFAGLMIFCLLIPSAKAIGISPLRNELSIPPGGSAGSEVIVVNETDKPFQAEPIVKVFYSNNEDGFPVYLTPTEQLQQNKIENFSSWIHISKDPVFVPAKGSVKVPFTVNVPRKTPAGGRYATIAYQPVVEQSNGVTINVRAASLLYVNVEGKLVRTGNLTYFGLPEKMMSDQPFVFDVTFQNTGNTHLKPTGMIEVTDLATGEKLKDVGKYQDPATGRTVLSDAIPVNLNKSSVLPGSSRTYTGEWKKNLKAGRYEANLTLSYADNTPPVTKSFEFELKQGGLEVSYFTPDVPDGLPNAFNLRVINRSNIYEKLTGSIEIEDPFDCKIGEIPLPNNLDYIAPGESRSFTFPWLNKGSVPDDRHTAILKGNYGFLHESLKAKASFGKISWSRVFLHLALILFFFALAGGLLIGGFIYLKKKRAAKSKIHRKRSSKS